MEPNHSQKLNSALILLVILFNTSCTTYKEFVQVTPQTNIPNGTKDILLNTKIEDVKAAFTSSGIMLHAKEGGFETEELLLDEGTRAMYKIHTFENYIRVTAYWGITQKAKGEIVAWAGADAASAYDVQAWTRVIYDKGEKRPKKVFDYVLQVLENQGLKYSYN